MITGRWDHSTKPSTFIVKSGKEEIYRGPFKKGYTIFQEKRKIIGNDNMNWDEYGMQLAQVAAMKSKDPWQKVGAAILRKDNTIGGIGYNGFPAGVKEDWENRDERRLLVVHAEQNALRYLKPGEGKTLYSTLLPCNDCLKTIAAYQIKRVLYKDIYQTDSSSLLTAKKLGIELEQY